MIFGRVPTAEAAGATLAHTLRAGDRALKKGRILDTGDIAQLLAAGITDVIAARLEPGELDEDAAAAAVASALAGEHARAADSTTGRANVFADAAGLVAIDEAAIHALNAHSDAITCATLAPHAPVRRGDMIATIKVIPFATGRDIVATAAAAACGAIAIRPWRGVRAALLMTRGPHDLARVAEVQRVRVANVGGALVAERVTEHETAAVAAALRELTGELGLDLVLMLGASAVMDEHDVIPAAIRAAGGEVERIGMPVDPGNLLVLGRAGATRIIGVPGCARSPKRSGFDFVLERIAAGVAVGRAELARMGVGGLLEDIAERPAPRASKIAAIMLAAGRSTRMGDNKLLAMLDGRPLVRHAVEAALGSAARPVVVVSGNDADAVRAALSGLDVRFVHNADFATGMATSLATGIANLDPEIDGALICLGDMPRVRAAHLDAIVAAVADGVHIVVPTHERRRGNPVLLGRAVFADVLALRGDVGARSLIERHADRVRAVAIDDPAVLTDVDTAAQIAELPGARAIRLHEPRLT